MEFSAAQGRVVIYLGDSGTPLDISRAIENFTPITTTALDIAGFIKATTTITISTFAGIDLDPRFNLRWVHGNKVTIETRNAANTAWILHRTLRILSNTYDDGRRPKGSVSPSLKLDLGCKIALLDSNYQSQRSYRIPVLASTPYVPFRTLLTFWLTLFKFPALSVASGDYSGNPNVIFDLPYAPGTSAAEHIGRYVYAYTGGYWWIDANENSRIWLPSLTPTTADFAYEGRECALNARSQNPNEKVAGLVRVLGVSNFVSAYVDPLPVDSSVVTGNVTETSTVTISTTPLARTTVKEGTQKITGVSVTTSGGGSNDLGNIGSFKETALEQYDGGFPSQLNPIAGQPDIPGLPAWLIRSTVSVEEQRQTTGNNLGGRSQTKSVVTEYFYRNTYTLTQGVTVTGVEVRKIVTTTKILPEGTTGGFNANALVDEVKTDEWIYLSVGRYRYIPTVIRPNDTENRRDTGANSAPGNSPPPATQFAPDRTNTQPIEIFGKAQFQYPPLAPDNEHPRDYDFKFYLPSNQVAIQRAFELGSLLIGRSESQELGLNPTDAYMADPHPAPVAFIHQDNNTTTSDVYLIDSVSLLFGLREQYVAGAGIWLGIRDKVSGVITAPFNQKVRVLATAAGREILTTTGQVIQLP